jgi:heme-degrading monooxygenase HmoA
MAARVMVFAKIKRGDEQAFEAAYAEVTAKVKGTRGHIADELLRQAEPPDPDDEPRTYVLLSEWEDKEAFLAWEDAPVHMQTTTPMRPYWAGRVERVIFDVAHTLKS